MWPKHWLAFPCTGFSNTFGSLLSLKLFCYRKYVENASISIPLLEHTEKIWQQDEFLICAIALQWQSWAALLRPTAEHHQPLPTDKSSLRRHPSYHPKYISGCRTKSLTRSRFSFKQKPDKEQACQQGSPPSGAHPAQLPFKSPWWSHRLSPFPMSPPEPLQAGGEGLNPSAPAHRIFHSAAVPYPAAAALHSASLPNKSQGNAQLRRLRSAPRTL